MQETKASSPPAILALVADVVLVLFLLTQVLQAQRFIPVDYSSTRAIYFFYFLTLMALLGRFWKQVPRRVAISIVVIAALVLIGQLTWTAGYGVGQANNYWQDWRLMVAAVAFGAAFGRSRWAVWRKWILGFGIGAAVLQAVSLLAGPFAADGRELLFYDYRPLSASTALLMICAFVIVVLDSPVRARYAVWIAVLLGISVILSQHRSAWVALAIAVALIAVVCLRTDWRDWRAKAMGVTVGFWALSLLLPVLAGLSILPGSGQTDPAVERALPTTVTTGGNLQWRFQMWQSRLEAPHSLDDVVLGGTLGPTSMLGPTSKVRNPSNSAHNFAIDQFIMLGLIGLGCIAVIYAAAVWACPDRLGSLPIFLWASLGFGFFYNLPVWVWVVLGVACTSAIRAHGGRDPAQGREPSVVGGGP